MEELLKTVLGDSYGDFESKINEYNEANPDKPIKFANLSDGGYVSKEKYLTMESQVKNLTSQLTDRDGQLKKLMASAGNNEELKTQIEKLQNDNKTAKTTYEKQLSDIKLNFAVDSALLKANALDPELVKVKLKTENIKLNEDGTVTGLSEQIDSVKKDFGFLFGDDKKAYNPMGGKTPAGTPNSLSEALKEAYGANKI